MLDLRTIDPARQSADRRVALVFAFVVIGSSTFAAVAAGAGGWVMAVGAALVLAELPWFLAFGARWRLLDDALQGVPFAWRGDRAGVWAMAPVSGAILTLVLTAALGFPTALAFLACLLGAAVAHRRAVVGRDPLRARDPARPHRPRAPLPPHHRRPHH